MRRISIFEMYLKGRGMNADSVKMSRYEQWFGTMSTGTPFFGRFSFPVTFGL